MAVASGEAVAYFDKRSKNYERFTGGCTRDIARHIISLAPPITSSSTILDDGCGSGIITEEIMTAWHATQHTDAEPPPRINAVDKAPSMLAITRAKIDAGGWSGSVTTGIMDAAEISFADDTFTHAFANFVVFFVPDAVAAVAHIRRTLKPGCTAVITAWADLGYPPTIQQAQAAIRPDMPPFHPPFAAEWYQASHFEGVLRAAGFNEIELKQRETAMRAADVDVLADLLAESFALWTDKWTEGEKALWAGKMREKLRENPSLVESGGGAAVRMIANVAVVTK